MVPSLGGSRALVVAFVITIGAVIAGCAVAPAALPAGHPANAAAPTGRLAGPPASLRPGVISYPDIPAHAADPAAEHHHHHAP
jgi:hypothetical protein